MTPEKFIAAVPEPKRTELAKLHAVITKAVPSFEPYVIGSMIGYGRYHYRYESGREGDSCRIGLAGNKTGISVYVSAVDANGWLAEQAKPRLGKANVGKSCIRFKQLADINLPALVDVLKKATTTHAPGETSSPSPVAASKKKQAKKTTTAKKTKAKTVRT